MGLTFSTADLVVFAELFWNPGVGNVARVPLGMPRAEKYKIRK
jgi:hypothetical protein